MKKVIYTICTSLLALNCYAAEENDSAIMLPQKEEPALTGILTITSNYIFRGITQTSNLPAFQGGLTYTFPGTGIYLNLWGSNVNFLDPQGNTSTVEIDTIAGYKNSIGEHFDYDINIDRYIIPNQHPVIMN